MHSILKSKVKLPLFLLIALLTGSVLWLYVNRYLTNSKANQPKVNVNVVPEIATFPVNTNTQVTFIVKPADAGLKMSGLDVTFVASGNASIVNVAPPKTFPGNDGNLFTEVKNSNNGTIASLSYVVTKSQDILPDAVQFVVTIKATQTGNGTITVDPSKSMIVGNISGYRYDLGLPTVGRYTFNNVVPTPTTNPKECTTNSNCSGSEVCDTTTNTCVAPTCGYVDPHCQTYFFSNHACVIQNKSNGTACTGGTCMAGSCVGVTITPTRTPTPIITGPYITITSSITPSVTPTVTTAVTPTPVTGNITVNMKLRFQGITRRPVTVRDFLTKVTLVNTNTRLSIPRNDVVFTVGDDGIWRGTTAFNALAGDGYYFLIKGPMHVQKKICESNPIESTPGSYRCGFGKITLRNGVNEMDFSTVYELVGDLPDQDGVVDSYDISYIRLNLGKNDNTVRVIGDINLDGRVDTQDYSLVIASLSVKKDEE